MAMEAKIADKDRFILQSESGDQWFVCNLLNSSKKSTDVVGQYSYEIVKIFMSENQAKEHLKLLMTFNKNKSKMNVVRKNKEKTSKKQIQEIIDARV